MNEIKYIKYFLGLLLVPQVLFGMQGKPLSIKNWGATCYINSVVQCIFNIKPLVDTLIVNDKYYKQGTLAREFIDLLFMMRDSGNSDALKQGLCLGFYDLVFDVMDLPRSKNSYNKHEDASEFLTKLLDKVLDSEIDTSIDGHMEYKKQVNDLFRIGLDQELGSQVTQAPALTIVELPITELSFSLKDCLNNYFSSEMVDFDNKKVAKKNILTKAPEYLIINLKRNILYKKNSAEISFDLENLDLSSYFDKNLNTHESLKNKYELVGFVSHTGNLDFGHYVSHVKYNNEEWYFCDDLVIDNISQYSIKEIARSGFYHRNFAQIYSPCILIYKKQDSNKKVKKVLEEKNQEFLDDSLLGLLSDDFFGDSNNSFNNIDWSTLEIEKTSPVNNSKRKRDVPHLNKNNYEYFLSELKNEPFQDVKKQKNQENNKIVGFDSEGKIALFSDEKLFDFNFNDNIDEPELHQAVKAKDIAKIKKLLDFALVDKDQKNKSGKNALDFAFDLGVGYEGVIDLLLQYY